MSVAHKPLYNGINTFLSSSTTLREQVGFVGIPYDKATTYRTGACFGPEAIRKASKMLTDGDHPELGVDPCSIVYDCGDLDINVVSPEKAVEQIASEVSKLSRVGQTTQHIFAGGDHLVTLGILRGLNQGTPPTILHFDAHCDTWESHFGETYGHGTWVRNAVEEKLVDPARFLSIGLRSSVDMETKQWLINQGGRNPVTSRQALRGELTASQLRGLARSMAGEKGPIYISFDIDVLDPSIAPGTGTPEPGGLPFVMVEEWIEGLLGLNLIGMDVVEVAPPYDNNSEITALCAAKLLWTYLAVIAKNNQSGLPS